MSLCTNIFNEKMIGAHLPVPVLDNCVSRIDNGAVKVKKNARKGVDFAGPSKGRSLKGHVVAIRCLNKDP